MSEAKRKAPGKMRLFLLRTEAVAGGDAEADVVLDVSGPGEISDADVRKLVDKRGPGEYSVITGRLRKASLSSRTVTEFKVE